MTNTRMVLFTGLAFILCLSGNVSAGETTKYTGTLYANPTKSLLPLGNGNGVMLVEASGIAALSGNPPAIFAVICAGMGVVDAESNATTDFYCNMKESEEDSFDIRGSIKEKKGVFDVIGGSGKWSGATGKGKFDQAMVSDEGSKNILELEITTK